MNESSPTGTVTFLFTDLESSTRQWEQDPDAMGRAVATHDELLREIVARHDGYLFSERGDGVGVAFWTVEDAVAAAVEAQRALRAEAWPDPVELSCRMGVHTGVADERDGDYFGPPVNQAARICEAAHGEQVLVSGTSVDLLDGSGQLRDLGSHKLQDLSEAVDLWQVVVDGDAGAYPAPRGVEHGEGELPGFRTSFHGREAEIGELAEQFRRWQIVTLCGPGGVGKTRLAVEVARAVRGRFERLQFVDLSSVDDDADVAADIAGAAGLPVDEGPSGQIDKLVRSWRNRKLLLVLDNCEHVIDGVAEAADRIAAGCSGLDVLATSREALAVEGERVYRVQSLPLGPAVELFIDRAQAVRARFDPTEEDRRRIEEICRHLDGLPLAIELAAARVAHLGLAQIVSHLDERFELLTAGRRRSRRRQQTLEATVNWSYDLLDDPQRELLRSLGVFTGGWDLKAAAAVWGRDQMRTLDGLGALVDKSLVTVQEDRDGADRYGLLETIRMYARQRLAAEGEDEERRLAHAEHFLRRALEHPPVAEDATPWGQPAEDVEDLENFLRALEWFDQHEELASVGRLSSRLGAVLAYGRFIDVQGEYLERDDVAAALEDRAERVIYLTASSMNANFVGRFEAWLEFADRAFDIAEDPTNRGVAGAHLALACSVFDPDRVPEIVEQALDDLPEGAESTRMALLEAPAGALLMQGRLEEALTEHENRARAGDAQAATEAMLLRHVLEEGDPLEGLPRARPTDPRVAAYSYRVSLVRALTAAAQIGHDDGAEQRAISDLQKAARAIESYPARLLERDVLIGCAVLAYHLGDTRHASELLAVAGPVLRTPASYAVYAHYRDLVKQHLDQDERQRIIDRAADLSASEILDEELERFNDVQEA